jgi:hypothetical protein
MITQENTTITLYREISGHRIPYIFELDAAMTIVKETPDFEAIRAEALAANLTHGDARAAVSNAISDAISDAQSGMLVHDSVKNVNTEQEKLAKLNAAIERAKDAGHTVVTAAPEILTAHPELSPAEQAQTGIISEEQLPGGGKKITYRPTARDIKVGEWVTSLVLTNPIEGTDELRAEFFAAEEAIKTKHAADGTTCKPCELGALIRKYRDKLEKQGYLQ